MMIRKLTIAGVLFSIATFASLLHGGEFVNIIAAAAAATNNVAPTPQPAPAPSASCDNCDGTGKLGDGTVSVTCPVCNGTGKRTTGRTPAATAPARKPAALVVPNIVQRAARRGYPVRQGWWTQNGQHLNSYAHLTTGRHAGKYDTAWLKGLTREEINSLHSDDHEGRVNWKYAVRPAKAPAAKAGGRWVMQRFCTGNGCVWRRVWVAN